MSNTAVKDEKTELETKPKKKRGRKPSKNKKGYYFQEEQENAVVAYISTDNAKEKDRIFNTVLKQAFTKMIESIIRRYNLYPPNEDFQQIFDDTMSFLLTKLSCFDPTTKYKAYSYCGTICKNYLIYKINLYNKNQIRNESYDNSLSDTKELIGNNLSFSYNDIDPKSVFINELTGTTVANINKIIENKDVLKLTDNEVKVGQVLINLMTNWDDIFAQMGSNKFNKSSILLFLKENTQLSTKDVRESLKIYKTKYYEIKHNILNE